MSEGPPLDDLLSALRSSDREVQRPACDALVPRVTEDADTRDAVTALLRDAHPETRFAAAFVLFHARPTLRILPALLEALELADGDRRWQAAQMLAALGRLQTEVFPVVLHLSLIHI